MANTAGQKRRRLNYTAAYDVLPKGWTRCPHCHRPGTVSNISHHFKNVHSELQNDPTALEQEWCFTCGTWIVKHQPSHHYSEVHTGEDLPEQQHMRVRDDIDAEWQIEIRERPLLPPPPNLPSNKLRRNQQTSAALQEQADSVSTSNDGFQDLETSVQPTISDQQIQSPVANPPPKEVLRNQPTSDTSQEQVSLQSAAGHGPENVGFKAPHAGSNDNMTQICRRRQEKTIQKLEETKEKVMNMLQRSDKQGRMREELPDYMAQLNRCQPVKILSYTEYRRLAPTNEIPAASIVLCSPSEAQSLLERTPPRIPLVVPAELRSDLPRRSLTTVRDYLEWLARTQEYVHIHDLSASSAATPPQVTGVNAKNMFFDPHQGPINMLDLRTRRGNGIPDFIDEVHALRISREVIGTGQAGRDGSSIANDLSTRQTFAILGEEDAWSTAHWDHHGKLTTLEVQDGEKNWLTWPQLSRQERLEWAHNLRTDGKSWSPSSAPYPIFLGPGDILVQPPGIVHAPFTLKSCLGYGSTHWHSTRMKEVMEQSNFELTHPEVTNEDPTWEAHGKFEAIERIWTLDRADGTETYPWGDSLAFEQFRKARQVCVLSMSPLPNKC